MAATIPVIEPARVTAGDRWQWDREDLSDYPAGTWTLTYALVKGDKLITLTATANGTYHRIDVAAATTADYPAGNYRWAAYATNGTDRQSVGQGEIEIRPNLAAQTQGYDARSFAQQRVDQLESAIASRDLMMAAYSVGGRSVQYRDWQQVQEALNYWRGRVVAERAKENIASGRQGARRLAVRL